MGTTKTIAVLFDFDSVITDMETQCTIFWDEQGHKYLNEEDFDRRIKGQTLTQIYEKYFSDLPEAQQEIMAGFNIYEKSISYECIPGIEASIADPRKHGTKIAVTTSSNEKKAQNVCNAHSGFKGAIDRILIREMLAHSKPAPDCLLLGMEIFGAIPESSHVFGDSFHGLQAGVTSGVTVIGLATTNTREAITGEVHYIIDGFSEMTFEHLLALHR